LEKNGTPKIKLDHIIKERYPTFVDALRDLDDALTLLFLFANLPSTETVPPKTIARCQRLCQEFQHYLIVSHSLRKSFLSIKGIYYQATIQGQDILWLVPYRFVQRVTTDVDYRIMGTFVEFYTTLLGFINFRLYTSIGLVYPPKFDATADEKGGELSAFTLESRKIGDGEETEGPLELTNGQDGETLTNSEAVQAKVDALVNVVEPEVPVEEANEEDGEVDNEAIDTFNPEAPNADTLPQPEHGGNEAAQLFSEFTFYISREAPRQPLEFLLRAFGSKRVGWDSVLGEGAFTHSEADLRITHQIVDRPSLPEGALPPIPETDVVTDTQNGTIKPGSRVPGRSYVQPQWVWDCVNEGKLLRPDLYAPGATLPPHLSPWVKPGKGYDPKVPLAEQEDEDEAEAVAEEDAAADVDELESETDNPVSSELLQSDDEPVDGGMDIAPSDEEDEEMSYAEQDDGFEGFEDEELAEDSDDEVEDTRSQYQKELEAEAAGLPFSTKDSKKSQANGKPAKTPREKKVADRKKKDAEELERQKMMMSRKKRKLLEKMLYSNQQKDDEAAKLRSKRRKIEKGRL
jgi:pescadillo